MGEPAREEAYTVLYTTIESPIGPLIAVGDGEALHGLHITDGGAAVAVQPGWERADGAFAEVRAQLAAYFEGGLRSFDLPLAMAGSAFQQRVWQALRDIPYGETRSYGQLARRIGVPSAPRAVGVANRENPIAVIVPCHRVIGADGTLTGYAGGLERKRALLDLEAGAMTLA
jgi:methylated-DNA-[protein]-cysteine S-methyltransferase